VTEVTPDQKKTLKVSGGVAVEAVDGAALAAGISPGDVIMRVNNVDVPSVKAFQERCRSSTRRSPWRSSSATRTARAS
jgi:serine protease Do